MDGRAARIPVHALLLSAVNVECDLNAERILIDRWCMLRVETPGGGESLLVATSRLRLATQALLRRRLRRTKHGLREGEEARPPGDLLAALASAPIPEAGVPPVLYRVHSIHTTRILS